MFENIGTFFKKIMKTEPKQLTSKDAAKERLHLVLMQDRANVSVDFLELMKQEILDVIKKYIEIDEKSIDVRLTNQANEDGTNGAPALYANIPIINIKNETKAEKMKENIEEENTENIETTTIQQVEQVKEKVEDKKQEEIESKTAEEVAVEEKKEEQEEKKDAEEEIDDVPTFDELLKKSEEEQAAEKEEVKKDTSEKPKAKKTNTNKSKSTSKSETKEEK